MSGPFAVPVRSDRELLDCLTTPARQGDYPAGSREFIRIDTSLRVYWHTLFDVCPRLLEFCGEDGLAIFRPFMTWAAERGLSHNWAYYLWVGIWLEQSPFADCVDDDLLYLLMSASAARWAVTDRTAAAGLVIGCSTLPDLVVGWKCRSVTGGREIERLELGEVLPALSGRFGMVVLPEFEFSHFPGWSPVPR